VRRHFDIILLLLLMICFSCNPEELIQDKKPPEAGQIESDDADGNFIFEPGTTHKFWINASDPEGKLLLFEWQVSGGEIWQQMDRDTVEWQLPAIGGAYSISVTISNTNAEISRSKIVTVLSYEKPVVAITTPRKGDFIVQHAQTEVRATAFHELGIRLVQFFINDSLINQQNGKDNGDYSITWDVVQDTNLAEIKCTAISKTTSITGADSITVHIEGFIVGKPAVVFADEN
jgi:hypothetical protein